MSNKLGDEEKPDSQMDFEKTILKEKKTNGHSLSDLFVCLFVCCSTRMHLSLMNTKRTLMLSYTTSLHIASHCT